MGLFAMFLAFHMAAGLVKGFIRLTSAIIGGTFGTLRATYIAGIVMRPFIAPNIAR